jgi:hypothetical protein
VNEGEAMLEQTLRAVDRVASAATKLERIGRIAERASRLERTVRPVARTAGSAARVGRALRPVGRAATSASRVERALRPLGRAAATTSRRAPRRRELVPLRDPPDRQLASEVGKAIERREVAQWARRLGASWLVIPKHRFGRYGLLKSTYRGLARPDMVAFNPRRREVLVGDVTSQPDADHLAKTVAYAQRLAGRLPPELAGWRVRAQEWYWGLSPEWGRRGSWPTSRRMPVA